ncbi:universal stress protein [Pandoraea sp. XY-2]|uniref:universal stress protein n=1 Tax=Pandoraea sp. XY-2 TaxID=2518599 RepID=UPI00101B08E7|nr:universal stress protein [Pandoraea sp. XY-2]QBC31912.1 hypothetical protein DRB87_11785 [Pandoraea sp. XY-2]
MLKRILVAIDGSPTADKAFDYALALAKARNAHLHVLFVVDIPVAYVADADPLPFIEAMRLQGKAIRDTATQRLKGRALTVTSRYGNSCRWGRCRAPDQRGSR